MNQIKRLLCTLLLALCLLGLTACGAVDSTPPDTLSAPAVRTVTDCFGRVVEIPATVKTIVCTGSGALRMVSYLQCTDRLVGVEDTDKQYETSTLRDYAHVNYQIFAPLPSIGKGGGTGNTAYLEELMQLQPDVILSGYNQEALEDLAKATGIPCVSIRARSINFIDESFYTAMGVAAEVLGAETRCGEVLQYIDDCKADLAERTAGADQGKTPSVYTGAVTFSGAHGFTGTYAQFGPFLGIGAKNVADETGETGYFDADMEKIIAWDPDLIFLDPGNLDLVREEIRTNPAFFQSLRAVREGKVYSAVAFNNYSTNVGYALADAYYAGTVLFPDRFADLDIAAKTDEILEFLLGDGYYDEMAADGLSFGVIDLGFTQ
ncbi:MAG: ABC transporter substrate-binding protein [Oscillibacter sp.]